MCHAVGFLVAIVDYVICLHWHRLIKNIEDKPKFWEGKMWYKLINAWAFPDFGVCTAGCPHSLHLCLSLLYSASLHLGLTAETSLETEQAGDYRPSNPFHQKPKNENSVVDIALENLQTMTGRRGPNKNTLLQIS